MTKEEKKSAEPKVEVEKFEIEDIKDPEDLDIDAAVAEEPEEEEAVPKESAPEIADEPELSETVETNKEKDEGDDKDVLEKVVEETRETPKPKKFGKIGAKKKWLQYGLIALGVILALGAAAYGAKYYLDQKNRTAETNPAANQETVPEEATDTPAVSEDKFLYINSEVGLNMRQEPNSKSKVLAIIPFGYKITVLAEQTGWIKTTYQSKEGWVSADYTQDDDPLVYENETYGFGFTFKQSWAGYQFIEANNGGSTTVKTYYVALPTTDKKWSEPGITPGYASLFVMGVYTKAEWAKIAGEEMKPGKLGEGDKYVYTYLPGQAYASDLKLQYGEIKAIIDTFEVLK